MKNLVKFAFLILSLSVFLISCATGHLGMYHYTHAPLYSQEMPTYPVYVDKDFGEADRLSIAEALDQWNYALNGHAKFVIVSDTFDMEPEILQRVVSGSAFVILKVSGDNPIVARSDEVVEEHEHKGSHSYSLGFTVAIGNHTIYLVRDRIKENKMVKGIVMHEVGHALGAEHVGDGLMFPGYDAERYQCVDYQTVKAVAEYHNWKVDTLNYCELGASLTAGGSKRLVDLGKDNQRLETPVDVIRR